MNIAALGRTILIGQMEGDRPAIITKVFSDRAVEATVFMPEPQPVKLVTIHPSRAEAVNASLRSTSWHGYWPTKV